jgi:hypothetical protein
MAVELFDVKKVMKPYRSTGTKDNPGPYRTMESMSMRLVSNGIPIDIIGKVMFKTFFDMTHNELSFKGDGTYASAGRELSLYIQDECVKAYQKEIASNLKDAELDPTICTEMGCKMRKRSIFRENKWDRIRHNITWPRVGTLGYASSVATASVAWFLIGKYSFILTYYVGG